MERNPCIVYLSDIIKKYRGLILEKLYEMDGYDFERICHLSDGYRDVIIVCYVKKKASR